MASFSLIALLATGQAVDINVSDPSWKTSVPAVISALAALATLTFTLVVWWRGHQDRMREQASKIYISTQRTDHPDGSMTVRATVHNKSDAPIWDVIVHPQRDGSPYDAATQTLPDILPSRAEKWEWMVSSEEVPREDRYPELIFIDGAQRRWKRNGLELTRIKKK
jgi:hypothetical protein